MSFTFNGKTNDSFGVRELAVTHSILPPSNNTTIDVVGRTGTYFVRKTLGVRKIEIDIAIIATDQNDLRTRERNIADWLDVDSPSSLSFSDEPDKQYFAILDGDTDIEQTLNVGQGKLNFICPDPYAYSTTLTTKSLAAGSNTVTNNGTALVYPKMTVTFASAQSSFEVSDGNGNKVHCDYSFGTNTTLVIDFNIGQIKINGTDNLQVLSLDSDFFPLVKGSNTFTVSAGASVSMTYNERFK